MKKSTAYFIVIFIFVSCNKNIDQTTYTKYYVDSGMKEFFFKQGSYWIYNSDSVNGKDSTFILRNDSGFIDIYLGLSHGNSYEYFSLLCVTNSPNDTSNTYPNTYTIERKHMLFNPNSGSGYTYIRGPVLFSIDTAFDWNYYYPSKNRLIDTLKIYDKIFYNVQECKLSQGNDTDIYYTVANVGVVKKIYHKMIHPQVWNIKNWKIVK